DSLVAATLERLEQKLAIQAVAGGQPERARGELFASPQGNAESRRRRDHGDRVGHREPARDHRALRIGLAVVPAPPEPRLRRRKLEHARAEDFQVLGPAVSRGKVGDDDERGTRVHLQELGDGQGSGRAGEAGDAQADFSLGETFRQRLECRPLSQHLDPNALRYHSARGGLASRAGESESNSIVPWLRPAALPASLRPLACRHTEPGWPAGGGCGGGWGRGWGAGVGSGGGGVEWGVLAG